MTDLPVPPEAQTALGRVVAYDDADVRDVARPVVAAWAREFAGRLDANRDRRDAPPDVRAWWAGRADAARALTDAADALDGGEQPSAAG